MAVRCNLPEGYNALVYDQVKFVRQGTYVRLPALHEHSADLCSRLPLLPIAECRRVLAFFVELVLPKFRGAVFLLKNVVDFARSTP